MERFSFNLQKVLDFRVNIEEKKKEEFTAAQKHFLTCEGIVNDLIEMKENTIAKTKNLKTAYDFQSYSKYIEYINTRIDASKENLIRAEEELRIKKEELLSCSMDRKAVEKLKDKARAEYDAEAARLEQKQNDDFALFAHMRREGR